MAFGINPALRYCLVGDRPVFLDLATGRYRMLGASLERDFSHFLGGGTSAASISRLQAKAILVEDPAADPVRSGPAVPASSLHDAAVGRPSLALVGETLVRQYRVRWRLRRTALQSLLAELQRPETNAHPADQRYTAIVAALVAVERLAGRPDDCLTVGIAMAQMLARRDLAFDFVIGVTLPFSAHCWVQCGPVVLTDSVERVEAFTPIVIL